MKKIMFSWMVLFLAVLENKIDDILWFKKLEDVPLLIHTNTNDDDINMLEGENKIYQEIPRMSTRKLQRNFSIDYPC
jgi:hypothetical protein